MGNTIYGLTNYYSTFASPVNSYEVKPVTNLLYGVAANKIYSNTIAKQAASVVSSYMTSMNSTFSNLKGALKPLSSKGPDSTFDKKAASSDDSNSLSGTAASNAAAGTYTFNITKLAQAQANTGTVLNSGVNSFITGVNTFSIKVGNKEAKNISFNVNESDTNKTSLGSMAKAINYGKFGVTANVYSDSKTGTSYLKLTSDKTGTDNAFDIYDVSGNAVSASGIGTKTTEAQNAEYTLDGKKQTSQENTVNINNNKVQVTFSKATGKDIRLSVGQDIKGIQADIRNFVNAYNNVMNFTNTNSSVSSGAVTLSQELSGIIKSRKASLEGMGIAANADGSLSIDSNKLEKAINSNPSRVKDILSGYDGIADKLYNKSKEVLTSPLKYSKPAELSGDFNDFYNYMISSSAAPSLTNPSPAPYSGNSLYSQNIYRGLVIDSLL